MDTEVKKEGQGVGVGSLLAQGNVKAEDDDKVNIPKARRSKKRPSEESDYKPTKMPCLSESAQQRWTRSRAPAHPIGTLLANDYFSDSDTKAIVSHSYNIDANARETARQSLRKHEQADIQKAKDKFKGAQELDDGTYKIEQCTTPLTVWQFISAYQMIKRETTRKPPFGGALCSDMGLGKTLTMLAVIAFGNKSKNPKRTLIIVPNGSIIELWRNEAEKRCDMSRLGPIVRYKQPTSNESGTSLADLESAGIIFTTYDEIRHGTPNHKELESLRVPAEVDANASASSLRPQSQAAHAQSEEEKDSQLAIDAIYSRAENLIFRIKFFRVLLDEGHIIKNSNNKTTHAIMLLRKKVGWVITGTPISNGVEEIFPFFRFIGDQNSQNRPSFMKHYLKNEEDETLKAMRKSVAGWFIKWRVSDSFLGRIIGSLPPVENTVQWINMSGGEKIILRSLLKVLTIIFNEHRDEKVRKQLKEKHGADTDKYRIECHELDVAYEAGPKDRGKDMKTFISYIGMIRNASTHSYMLETAFRNVYHVNELVELHDALRTYEQSSPVSLQEQIGSWDTRFEILHGHNAETPAPSNDTPALPSQTSSPQPFGISDIGTSFHLVKQLQCLITAMDSKELKCVGIRGKQCQKPSHGSFWRGKYGHIFCSACRSDLFEYSRKHKSQDKNLCSKKGCDDADASDIDGDDEGKNEKTSRVRRGAKKVKPRQPGDDIMGYQPKPDPPSDLLALTDKDPCLPLVGGSKLTAVKETVLRWQMEAPEDKLLIFAGHKIFAQCIGRVLQEEKISFLYYFGDTNTKARDRILDKFKGDNGVPILIISMDCGGQGLNITEANRVIIAELWWNESREEQAFGRVSRIGQTKPMFHTRIVVRGSIEQAIRRQSQLKTKTINSVLLHEDVSGLETTVYKLMRSLGDIKLDKIGRIVGFDDQLGQNDGTESVDESD